MNNPHSNPSDTPTPRRMLLYIELPHSLVSAAVACPLLSRLFQNVLKEYLATEVHFLSYATGVLADMRVRDTFAARIAAQNELNELKLLGVAHLIWWDEHGQAGTYTGSPTPITNLKQFMATLDETKTAARRTFNYWVELARQHWDSYSK